MSVLCQECHDTIAQDEYTQTPPNIPEYATIISINTNKNKDNKTYRTEATIATRSRSPSTEKEKRKIFHIFLIRNGNDGFRIRLLYMNSLPFKRKLFSVTT